MAINKKDSRLFSEREKGEGEEREKKNQKVNARTLPSLQADSTWVFLQMADFQGACQPTGLAWDTEVSQLVLVEL